ncbi:MAG TPA: hypothetical protein VFV93_00890 [Thermomicrobiales bacterium]|nr:hypothetical protein [Thermomicrobiales bacterium]
MRRRRGCLGTAAQLVGDPDLLVTATAEFNERADGFTYKAAIPEGAELPKPHI